MADSFRRVRAEKGWTAVSNQIFFDREISLKAKGLLCLALSLPEDWSFSIRGLASLCKENITAIQSGLDELEAHGYLRRRPRQEHKADGTFGGMEYVFYEVPETEEDRRDEGIAAHETESTSIQNPYTVYPYTENPPQENNKQEINKQDNPLKPPKGGGREAKKPKDTYLPEWKPERFAAFWAFYPNGNSGKGNRYKAARAWDKLRPDDELLSLIGQRLKQQMCSEMWQRGVGIPYASTYLNQRRWEDAAGSAAAAPPSGQVVETEVLDYDQ